MLQLAEQPLKVLNFALVVALLIFALAALSLYLNFERCNQLFEPPKFLLKHRVPLALLQQFLPYLICLLVRCMEDALGRLVHSRIIELVWVFLLRGLEGR